MKKIWVIKGEYYYSPHSKYEGVYELYFVDKNKIEHCIMNFCLPGAALALAKEDQAWKKLNCKISHRTQVDWDIKDYERCLKVTQIPIYSIDEEPEVELEKDSEEAKKEARKKRREARKNKSSSEAKNGNKRFD